MKELIEVIANGTSENSAMPDFLKDILALLLTKDKSHDSQVQVK